ncbi:MAG TPA: hypothetical protein VFL47_11905 [Flavisolibacter sp.]|nr:hypothetical protein [Flavisolibacter sp.]
MKRFAAILFSLVLVFNFYGYRMVLAYIEKSGTALIEKKLDHNAYSNDELLSIKTKLNLPYYTSSSRFERAYGTVNIKGVVYTYVKQRVYNDTLELLCLPDAAKTKLQTVKNELTKSAADGQASLPLKKSADVKISLPDFCQSLPIETALTTVSKNSFVLRNEVLSFFLYNRRQERPPQESSFSSLI